MRVDGGWSQFGAGSTPLGDGFPVRRETKIFRLRQASDRAAAWLRNAMLALGLLAVAAAVVSWEAQYRMVYSARHSAGIAALEAAIPDAGSVIFASLGIALALHGKRAIRARTLNVCCVAVSVGMNALAAGSGWRDLAIWVMPPVVYALASDTLIGVIRAWAIAPQRALGETLADDEATPLAILGGLLLWLLRLALAPKSTLGASGAGSSTTVLSLRVAWHHAGKRHPPPCPWQRGNALAGGTSARVRRPPVSSVWSLTVTGRWPTCRSGR
jgi:hypothetical protein